MRVPIRTLCVALAVMAPGLRAEGPSAAATPTLAELAAASDVVALVQVRDTDYEYTRGFPTGGTAFLKMLIPYRVTRPVGQMLEVYEEGLHANECYFESPAIGEEGRRHLVFLRASPDVEGQFRGLAAGCALQVLVTADNRYVLRYPLAGIEVADDLRGLASTEVFADRYAVMEDDELAVGERNELLSGGFLQRLEDGGYRYTHGVGIADLRALLGAENLTVDRALLRPAAEPE